MKIFYYFQELETNMFRWQRTHIIDELKYHDVEVDTFNPLHYANADEANDKALCILRKNNYDLFFTNVCYYKMLYVDTIKSVKKMGIPTLCLRCDNLIIPFNDEILAPHFDLVWLTSKETKGLYDKWGVKSVFVPYAANPFFFNYRHNELIRKVCFIGTPYGSRSIMINRLSSSAIPVDAFCYSPEINKSTRLNESQLKHNIITQSRLSLYFNYFRFNEGRKVLLGSILNRIKGATQLEITPCLNLLPFLSWDEISSKYSSYALCLASTSTNHTDSLKNPLKVVNLRSFEIPMSGGIAICKYNPELAEYFESGKEIVFYNSDEELVEKAQYYIQIAKDNEIISMKEAARKRAENEHTWWDRFSIFFEMLALKY